MLNDTKRLIPISDRVKVTLPPKPKRWSHQDDLQEMVGKKVQIAFIGRDDLLVGVLVAADAFTLKVDAGDRSGLTYFKHALTGYYLDS